MRTTAKATPASLRRRLAKIHAQAQELVELVQRWDPKGRHFQTRRDLAVFAPSVADDAAAYLKRLESTSPNQRRLARGLAPRPAL